MMMTGSRFMQCVDRREGGGLISSSTDIWESIKKGEQSAQVSYFFRHFFDSFRFFVLFFYFTLRYIYSVV